MRDLHAPLPVVPFLAANWYPAGDGQVVTGAAPGLDSIRAYPFEVRKRVTISDLAARVTTLHAANNLQLAIYANKVANNRPGGVALASTPNISTAATGVLSGAVTPVTLDPGLIYWGCINNSGATAVFLANALLARTTSDLIGSPFLASAFGGAAVASVFVSSPLAFGTWGDLTSATWTEFFTAAQAAIAFKVAA